MRRLRAALILTIAAVALALALSSASAQTWSAPASIATCGGATQPKVVFPFSYPSRRSGEGGILWLGAAPGCPAGATGPTTVDVAGLHSDDQPAAARPLAGAPAAGVSLAPPLTVLGTTNGQVVAIAGSSAQTALASPEAVLGEGFATTGFHKLSALGGSADLLATANGFIGDADIADVVQTPGGSEQIELLAQRHFAFSFGPPVFLVPVGSAPVTALALGMDFRADTIVVWAAGGEIWAQWVTNHDRVKGAPQPLGPSGYAPQISTVLSDDDRAFVAWTDEPPLGTSGVTRVFLDHSAAGVIFHSAEQIASFTEPADVRLTPGALSIDRLSLEGLALVWPMMRGGNYALEAAGVTAHKILTPALISVSGEDLRLGAVATGPRDEIVVLVEVAPRTATGFDATRQQILATRDGQTKGHPYDFTPLEQLAAAGMNSNPSVAVDPDTDRAVAAWQSVVPGVSTVQWAVSQPG